MADNKTDKPLTLKAHAMEQLGRIQHFSGFPRGEKLAIADYVNALCVAGTVEGVTRVLDDITSQVWEWCPSAAVLRAKAYEQAAKPQEGCQKCDWTGWRIVQRGGLSGAAECECRKRQVKKEA